jgi:hypothetical protein
MTPSASSSYEELAAAALLAFGGDIDFSKKVPVGENRELTHTELIMELVMCAPRTFEAYIMILFCMNPYISKCINDTIDAAKNGFKVLVLFLKRFETYYRSGAVSKKDFVKLSLLPGPVLGMNPVKLSVRGAIDEMKKEDRDFMTSCAMRKEKFYNKDEGKWQHRYVVEDILTQLRNQTAIYAQEKMEELINRPIKSKVAAYATKDTALHSDLHQISSLYITLMGLNGGDKKNAKKACVSMARNLLRNYARLNPKYMFHEAYRASQFKTEEGEIVANSFYLAFAPEAIEYFVNEYCPNKMFQNKVYKFGNGYARIGQWITFEGGVSVDGNGYYTENAVDGTFQLLIDEELNPIIEVPVRDMVPEVEYDDRAIIIQLDTKGSEMAEQKLEAINKNSTKKDIRYFFAYAHKQTHAMQNHPRDARMALWASFGEKPPQHVCDIYIETTGKSYYQNFLKGKTFNIEQIEVVFHNLEEKIIMIGHC